MLRRLLCLAALAVPVLVGTSAFAQDGGVGSAFAQDDFAIRIQSPMGAALSDFNLERFFNKARCDCNEEAFVFVGLSAGGFAKKPTLPRDGTIQVFIGTGCNTQVLTERPKTCLELGTMLIGDFLNVGTLTLPVTAQEMSADPTEVGPDGTTPGRFVPNTSCTLVKKDHTQTIWVVLDTDNNGTPDTSFSNSVKIDLQPPPAPDSNAITAVGGQQAVTINWPSVDITTNRDLIGYQILCQRAEGLQVFPDGSFDSGFKTCDKTPGVGAVGLDPRFICSPLLQPSTGSFRVKILQNDITYGVGVVSIDKSGNASVPDIFFATATKTKSFYDVYRDGYNGTSNGDFAPGEASGGFCTLVPGRATTGTAFGLAGAAAAVAAVLIRRRRRR